MSKWYEWNALKELVTPEQYQESTLCKFVSQIGEKIIFEYDCYFLFSKTESQIGMFHFFYYIDGILLSKRYAVFYYGTHIEFKLNNYGVICYHLDDTYELKKNYTFIGNWRDGQEYLSKIIDKLRREDANKI